MASNDLQLWPVGYNWSSWNAAASTTIVDMRTVEQMFEAQRQQAIDLQNQVNQYMSNQKEMEMVEEMDRHDWKNAWKLRQKVAFERQRDPRRQMIQRALRDIKEIAKAFGPDWEVRDIDAGVYILKPNAIDGILIPVDCILDNAHIFEAARLLLANRVAQSFPTQSFPTGLASHTTVVHDKVSLPLKPATDDTKPGSLRPADDTKREVFPAVAMRAPRYGDYRKFCR